MPFMEEKLKLIKEIILNMAKKYNIEVDKIILFGSRARGDYREDSDWDLLIVIKEEIREDFKKKLLIEIHRELVRKIFEPFDVIILNKEYFEKYKKIYGDIAGIAVLEGKII